MKKTLLMLAMLVAGYSSYAQTNTFPSSGNVGIGNTSPGTQLELRNGSGLAVIASNAKIMLSDITAGMYLRMDNASNLQITNNGFSPLVSFMQSGNVGIGMTPNASNGLIQAYLGTPAYSATTFNPSTLRLVGSATNGAYSGIGFSSSTGNREAFLGVVQTSATAGDLTYQSYTDGVYSEKLRVTNAGNVGIGTTDTHGYKFAVNGNVIATSMTVKLYADWPDYVFKKDYKLASLTEVKTYIDRNQHLPDMPSEQEVAKDGINLGEMVKLQTKKIEELTLYLLEQQKQIDQLKLQLNTIIKK